MKTFKQMINESLDESDIVYEIGDYWVSKSKTTGGYDLWKSGITHSTRCGQFGSGSEYLARAKAEANKRNKQDNEK